MKYVLCFLYYLYLSIYNNAFQALVLQPYQTCFLMHHLMSASMCALTGVNNCGSIESVSELGLHAAKGNV